MKLKRSLKGLTKLTIKSTKISSFHYILIIIPYNSVILIIILYFSTNRFYTLLSIHGRVDPLAEVDLSPPKHADVKVVYNQSNEEVTNDENEEKQTKLLKIDLNKSVKDFKVQLRSVFQFFPFL